jgi:hypothetical protein
VYQDSTVHKINGDYELQTASSMKGTDQTFHIKIILLHVMHVITFIGFPLWKDPVFTTVRQ